MTTPQPAALPEFIRVLVRVQGGESHSTEAQFMSDDIGYLVCVPREWQPAALQSQPAAAGVSDAALPPDALAMCMHRAVEGFSEFLVGKCTGEPPRLSMAFVISLFEAILKETDKSKQLTAVAPDAVIDEIIGHAEQAVGMSHSGWDNVNPRELVRAILALRPQAVPMTPEPVAYFSYGEDSGYLEHATAGAANKQARADITAYRGDAMHDNEWPSEVASVCWGVVLQKATAVDNSDEVGQESFDYELAPRHGITAQGAQGEQT